MEHPRVDAPEGEQRTLGLCVYLGTLKKWRNKIAWHETILRDRLSARPRGGKHPVIRFPAGGQGQLGLARAAARFT